MAKPVLLHVTVDDTGKVRVVPAPLPLARQEGNMTHDEWIGQIMQAVAAAQHGNNQDLHRLASLLMAQEAAGPHMPGLAVVEEETYGVSDVPLDEPTDVELDADDAQSQWERANEEAQR